MLHEHLKARSGADHSTKALAHMLLSLGDLQVPFDTVYPLVLTLCDVLHDRSRFMDATCAPLFCTASNQEIATAELWWCQERGAES